MHTDARRALPCDFTPQGRATTQTNADRSKEYVAVEKEYVAVEKKIKKEYVAIEKEIEKEYVAVEKESRLS